MSRKPPREAIGRRGDGHAVDAAISSLRELRSLSALYDSGEYRTARTIATILQRLLSSELQALIRQNQVHLKNFSRPPDYSNLFDDMPLINIGIKTVSNKEFIRFTSFEDSRPKDYQLQSPKKWLSEVIYAEGKLSFDRRQANPSGSPFFRSPQRLTLTRADLIECFRNELGAHFDADVSAKYTFATTWNTYINFELELEDGTKFNMSEHPEHFINVNTLGEAMIRSLAYEVMESITPADKVREAQGSNIR